MTHDQEEWLMIIGVGISIITAAVCFGVWLAEVTAP